MKKFSILALAAAGMLFAACAENDVIVGNDPQNEISPEGYMALNINLPTAPSTRAANDDFDDGLADEYQVNKCALLLFEGTTEAGATLFNAQQISFDTEVNADKDNVTSSHLAVATVKGRTTTGGKIYALALLNFDKVMSFDTDGFPLFKEIVGQTGDGDKKIEKGKTLSDIRALITSLEVSDLIGSDKDNFFMTNAVLSKDQGGVVTTAPNKDNVFQLAELDPTKVYGDPEKAKKNPAGEIFVERAVAKATLDYASNLTVNGLEIESVTWAIDNMEPNTYVFRNPGDDLSYISYINSASTNYRFVGNVATYGATPSASATYYRTYWCIDPQYNDENMTVTDTETGAKNSVGMLKAPTKTEDNKEVTDFSPIGSDNPLYCFENTFDVKHQSYRNTTRAIIKVTLKKNDAGEFPKFWTINGGTARFTNLDDVKGDVAQFLISNAQVQSVFNENYTGSGKREITKEDFKITYKTTTNSAGVLKVDKVELATTVATSSEFKEGFADAFKALFTTTDGETALLAALNASVVIRQYDSGEMYYEARFQHFAGEGSADLAPWNTTESTTAPTGGSTANAYPGYSAENYLGRYGMVRNNWYYVEVLSFNNFGYPKDPSGQVENEEFENPDTPDDNLKDNIAVKIHVLSWALRNQSWRF